MALSGPLRSLAGASLPFALAALFVAFAHAPSRPPRACGPVPAWLAERLKRPANPRTVAEERALLEAMARTGNRGFDRHVVARILMSGSDERYDSQPLLAAMDEAAITKLLSDVPAFQVLQARVRNPSAFKPSPPPPPAVRPQELAAEAAPETANDLLEALREAPKPPPPPAPKPPPPAPDPYAEAARLIVALRDEEVKSRALLRQFADHPEAFASVVASATDPAELEMAFEAGLARSLTVALQDELSDVLRHVTSRLEQKGFPLARIETLAAERPDELRHVIRVQLAEVLAEKPRPDWRLEAGVATLLARRDVGNYAYGVVLSSLDLVLSAFEAEARAAPRLWPADSPYFTSQSLVRVRRCHGPVCLPPLPPAGKPRGAPP